MSVELKPIKTKKIYEVIVDQIRQLVLDGHVKPGDKLPSERHLVESFKVSRASIREALSALEMMGLLEVRTGEGAYIRQLHADSMATALTWALSMEKSSILEIFEVRRMMEIQAAGFAAERATTVELHQLERILYSMIERRPDWEKADHHFHYLIAKATQNKITIRLMDTISDHIQHLIRLIYPQLFQDRYTPEILYKEHWDIFDAIKSKDPERAKESMLKHLEGVEKVILKKFQNTL